MNCQLLQHRRLTLWNGETPANFQSDILQAGRDDWKMLNSQNLESRSRLWRGPGLSRLCRKRGWPKHACIRQDDSAQNGGERRLGMRLMDVRPDRKTGEERMFRRRYVAARCRSHFTAAVRCRSHRVGNGRCRSHLAAVEDARIHVVAADNCKVRFAKATTMTAAVARASYIQWFAIRVVALLVMAISGR